MLKKMMACAGLAVGLAVGVAGPAQAASGQQVVGHGLDGLGGSITISTGSGSTINLAQRQTKIVQLGTTDPTVKQLRAGSGYCVWERFYVVKYQPGPGTTQTETIDYNYGKGESSRWYTLKSLPALGNTPYGTRYTSNLAVYAC